MSKLPVVFSEQNSSASKNMVPSASDMLSSVSEKVVEIETETIAAALKKLAAEFDSIASSSELRDSSAKKLTVSLAIRADGSIGISGLASARNSIQSSMTLEFEID